MIEDRQLTREATWLCNNGEYKTVKQVAAVQLRWMSECPEVDPNPLGFVGATQWQLTPQEVHEYNVVDQSSQLAAVTKERDELRAMLSASLAFMPRFSPDGPGDRFVRKVLAVLKTGEES